MTFCSPFMMTPRPSATTARQRPGLLVVSVVAGLLVVLAAVYNCPEAAAFTKVDDVIELDKPEADKQNVKLNKPLEQLANPLQSNYAQTQTITVQDKLNLDMLWSGIVDGNPILQFGIKRLATPPELRDAHNSVMSRALGSMISGVGMLPYAFGAGPGSASGAVVGSSLLNRALFKVDEAELRELPTDRELVELSSLIQELQQNLVLNYFAYKGALWQVEALKIQSRQTFDNAGSDDQIPSLAGYVAANNEVDYQMALVTARHRLVMLERLVSPEVISKLRFTDDPTDAYTPEAATQPAASSHPATMADGPTSGLAHPFGPSGPTIETGASQEHGDE
ncbi:MAG: hypothetical protein KC475_03645 [Cyanobacteria bacterium HKST-UBA03]|nr:hypothetical protein [Cyanobacteria bacterium HKST-UBA03]